MLVGVTWRWAAIRRTVLFSLLAFAALTPTAHAQATYTSVVTGVVDGDTLTAQLADGESVTFQLIGVDTPETVNPEAPVECGGPAASTIMRDLVLGQHVALTPDPPKAWSTHMAGISSTSTGQTVLTSAWK